MPTADRPEDQPWPYYPMRLRTSASHEEGGDRQWDILTKAFIGTGGRVQRVRTVNINLTPRTNGPPLTEELPGTEREWPADLVLIAIGYSGPEHNTVGEALGVTLSDTGAIATNDQYMTSVPGIFAAGDARMGQSLIVWAIAEGREAARSVDLYLTGKTDLPGKGCCDLPRIG